MGLITEDKEMKDSITEDLALLNDENALPIRQDPIIEKLLKKLPPQIADYSGPRN